MPFADNQGIKLHWQEQGTGTPVLLIMGHRLSSRLWYPAIPALATKHRVIYFDNRGIGGSGPTPSRFTVQDLADDAAAVMDAAGVEAAHVFGVSLGGGIAMELAMRKPQRVRSLILGCTAIKTAEGGRMPAWIANLYYMPRWVLEFVVNVVAKRAPNGRVAAYGSAANRERVDFDLAVLAQERYSRAGAAGQLRAVAQYQTTLEAAARLTMPALVIHGKEDTSVAFSAGEQIAATLPNGELMALEGAGHNFFPACGPQVNVRILDFLQKVERTASQS